MNDKKYNVLDSALQDISGSIIRLSDKDKKRYNAHLKEVLDCIIEQMKKNEVFKFLYRTNVYTGSFYENLRISKPDEFDINLIFVVPATCKIIYDQKQPGFVKIKVNSLDESQIKKHLHDVPSLEKILKSWIDPKTKYLQRTLFMQWMQSVFGQALDGVTLNETTIKRSSSGPAFTVKVSQPRLGLSEYSVDLVPVFEFSEEDLPSTPVRKLPKGAVHKEWTVVPKPPPDVIDTAFWRMSFYKQEKEIMNNLNGMKHIIKLMKLFRDTENWKTLSSYAIKTVFLWECENQPKEGFWQNSVGQLFVHMLKRLSEHLIKQRIPFYWDKNLNLLSKVKGETLNIMNNRIIVVLKKIDLHLNDDPQFIKHFFNCAQKEIHENNRNKSNTNDSTLKELCHRQPDNTLTSSRTSPEISRIQEPASEKITLKKGTSSVHKTNNMIEWELPKIKEEDKIDVAVQFRIGSKNDTHQTNNISDSINDILSVILKEQSETKQSLQILTQQHKEMREEIERLKEDNAKLWKHLQHKSHYDSTSQPSVVHSFLDSQPFANTLTKSLLVPTSVHLSTSTTGRKTSTSDTSRSNPYMSELVDVFTSKQGEVDLLT